MDGSLSLSIKPTTQSGAPQAGIDSIAACWIHSTKPAIVGPLGVARRHARDLADIQMLRARSRDAAGDLIDFGAGHCYSASGMELALQNLNFAFTARERSDAQREIDSHRDLALACRAELAALPSWAEMAQSSSWADLAREAARREAIS